MKQTTYNLHINNIERREALKTFTDLGLVSIAGSLGLSYVWNNHKDSSAIESNIANHEVIKHSIHTESKPYFMQYPYTTLFLSSYLTYSLPHLFTLLKSNTSFIILLDSIHTPLLELLQNIKDNIYNISEKYIYKNLKFDLVNIMQSLQNHNKLFYIHNPGAYAKNSELARESFIDVIKKNVFSNVALNSSFGRRSDSIFKEAYCKVLCYLDLATDKHLEYLSTRIPNTTKEKIKELFNPKTLMDTENLIQTKVKISSNASNDDKNFEASKTMTYSKDFIIQLKRIAEYSYQSYKGAFMVNDNDFSSCSKVSKSAPFLCRFVYNEKFIPTTIDVKD